MVESYILSVPIIITKVHIGKKMGKEKLKEMNNGSRDEGQREL